VSGQGNLGREGMNRMVGENTHGRLSRLFALFLLLAGAVAMLMPFYWMLATSVKTYQDSVQIPPVWVPAHFDFSWYGKIFAELPFGRYYLNTVIMTIGRTVPQVLFCAMAAYSFARLRFRGRNAIFISILAVLMVPSQVVLIPKYYEIVLFNWVDTYKALIVPGLFSAYGTFLLRQFFLSLPKELEEAAIIDGASYWSIFWKIMLPLIVPALSSLTFFVVLDSWGEFLWPLVVISDDSMKVLSVGINSLQGLHTSQQPLIMAGAVLGSAPLLVAFLLFQRFIIKGIAFSGIKG
jgi:multiple sugar transport system permease protein